MNSLLHAKSLVTSIACYVLRCFVFFFFFPSCHLPFLYYINMHIINVLQIIRDMIQT